MNGSTTPTRAEALVAIEEIDELRGMLDRRLEIVRSYFGTDVIEIETKVESAPRKPATGPDRKPHTRMTEDDIRHVLGLRLVGRTHQQIVEETGLSVSSVRRALLLVDHPSARCETRLLTDEQEATIRARAAKGKDLHDLAEEYEVSWSTIRNVVTRGKGIAAA